MRNGRIREGRGGATMYIALGQGTVGGYSGLWAFSSAIARTMTLDADANCGGTNRMHPHCAFQVQRFIFPTAPWISGENHYSMDAVY